MVTGCTMGKCNIDLIKGSGLSATFTKGDRKLRIRLKKDLLKQLLYDKENDKAKCVAYLSSEHFENIFDIVETL